MGSKEGLALKGQGELPVRLGAKWAGTSAAGFGIERPWICLQATDN